MKGLGIKFYPLYWIYHDNWINRTWSFNRNIWSWQSAEQNIHYGHIHFFMPNYPIRNDAIKGKAYEGEQEYEFSLESIWGPDSGNPNQTDDTHFVGKPKWYFEVTEYWRRIYIQPWDNNSVNVNIAGIIGRTGIKYDASHSDHTYGPFREGKEFFFYWNQNARTLPIEYYKDENKRTRDNFLNGSSPYTLPAYSTENYVAEETKFAIPNGGYSDRYVNYHLGIIDDTVSSETANTQLAKNYATNLGGTYVPETNRYEYSEDFGHFQQTFGDKRYIFPIIEYQSVKHLNFERLPGWENRDSSEGGDGFSISVTLPYKINNVTQSPFSDDNGQVGSIGNYYHGFSEKFPDKINRFPKYDKCDIGWYQWIIMITETVGGEEITRLSRIITSTTEPKPEDLQEGEFLSGYKMDSDGDVQWGKNPDSKYDEFRMTEEMKGKPFFFHVPEGMSVDGKWVEQCLGGIVRARAEVKIVDNYGEEKTVSVTTTKFYLNEEFEGSDQNSGV